MHNTFSSMNKINVDNLSLHNILEYPKNIVSVKKLTLCNCANIVTLKNVNLLNIEEV